MARVLDEEIRSSADLGLLPELTNAAAGVLGNPALMSPAAMQAYIQQRKAEASAAPGGQP